MTLDIRTMVVMIGLTHLLQMVVLFMQYRENRDIEGPGWWLAWISVQSFGFVLIILRQLPALLPLSKLLLNPVLVAGAICIYIGLLRFFGRPVPWKALGAVYAAYFAVNVFFLTVVDSIEIRTFLFGLVLAIMGIVTGMMVLANRTRDIASTAMFNAILFFLHSAVFVYRCLAVLFGEPVVELLTPTVFNYVQYFDAFVVGLMWTFGFIVMLNQRLHAQVSETKQHFEMLFNINPDSVAITRVRDGRLVDLNESFSRISGYTPEEALGRTTLEIGLYRDAVDRDRTLEILRRAGRCENLEVDFRRKDGGIITCLVSARSFMIGGEPHLISVTRDISDRKNIEHDLQETNEELRKVNAEKDKFASIITHDLRSPFNAIIGMSALLRDRVREGDLSDVEESSDIIFESSKRAMELLSNLTDWSRAHTGRMPFDPEHFALAELTAETLTLYADIAAQKSITIETDIAADCTVHADWSMIATVLRNLLSNAIKFTPKGGRIRIVAEAVPDGIRVAVSDTGVGIPEEAMPHLFVLAGNHSTTGTDNEQGTGLGLILCDEFIQRHGSRLHVQSTVGAGSTFSFILPL